MSQNLKHLHESWHRDYRRAVEINVLTCKQSLTVPRWKTLSAWKFFGACFCEVLYFQGQRREHKELQGRQAAFNQWCRSNNSSLCSDELTRASDIWTSWPQKSKWVSKPLKKWKNIKRVIMDPFFCTEKVEYFLMVSQSLRFKQGKTFHSDSFCSHPFVLSPQWLFHSRSSILLFYSTLTWSKSSWKVNVSLL